VRQSSENARQLIAGPWAHHDAPLEKSGGEIQARQGDDRESTTGSPVLGNSAHATLEMASIATSKCNTRSVN
jgi:hypothetical protein